MSVMLQIQMSLRSRDVAVPQRNFSPDVSWMSYLKKKTKLCCTVFVYYFFYQYLQKLVSPTVQLIMEYSRAAPRQKNIGKNRYTPKRFLPGTLSNIHLKVEL